MKLTLSLDVVFDLFIGGTGICETYSKDVAVTSVLVNKIKKQHSICFLKHLRIILNVRV